MRRLGGTAAALAVKDGESFRELDVIELQIEFVDAGSYLGDRARLKELGIM